MKTFKTKTGLELPLMDLKGREYLQVCYRVQWWRVENPLGRIDTERVESTDKYVLYKATISIPVEGVYVKLADGYKREDYAHFGDANEKASTGAIGRALALCGYGTQFAPELDEEERIVDAPIERPRVSPVLKSSAVEGSLAALVATVKTRGLVEETKLYMRKHFGFEESARLSGLQITQVLNAMTAGEIKKISPRDPAWVAEPFDMNAGDTRL